MTEQTRLISYLLYGLFSAFLNKNTIRTQEVIFHIRLRTPWLDLFVAHTKMFLYASFSFSYWKYSCTTFWPSFLLFSPTHSLLLLATQKSREKFHDARSLQENNAHSAANQSGRTNVAIIIINNYSSRTRRIWADIYNQRGHRPSWLLSAHIRQVREE